MMDNEMLESKVRKKEVVSPKLKRSGQAQSTHQGQENDSIQRWHHPVGSPPIKMSKSSTAKEKKIEQQLINDRLPTSLIDSFFSNSLFYEATTRNNPEEIYEQVDVDYDSHYASYTDSDPCSEEDDSDDLSSLSDDDDEYDDLPKSCIWPKIDKVKSFPFPRYNAPDHLMIPIVPDISPLDCYLQFVTNDVWELLVAETNRFANQYYYANSNSNESLTTSVLRSVVQRTQYWTATNIEEMKKFIGIIICMSLVSYPSLRDFWSEDNHIFGNPLIKASMTYERFFLLSKFLRFSNVDILLEVMSNKFQNILLPGKDLIIHPSVIPVRDKKFQQHNGKKCKTDVMFYKLCTAEGYTLKNVILTDDLNSNRFFIDGLLEPYLNEGRVIFLDKTLTNVQLAEELLKHKTMICGHLHRKRAKNVIKTKVNQDEVIGVECPHDVGIIKWCNKVSSMTILTTVPEYKAELVDMETGKPAVKPTAVLDYFRARRGVNLIQPSRYPKSKDGLKWYNRIVFELFVDTIVVNAWIVYTIMSKAKFSLNDFRSELVRHLLSADDVKKEKKHILMCKNGVQDFNKDRKRCKGCYKKHAATMSARDAANATKKVRTFCDQCNKYYCLPCFNDAHEQM